MTRPAAVASTTLPTDRPPSLLPWQDHDADFVAADYRIRLLEPYQWEVSHRGRVLEINRSRRSAFEAVEGHHRGRRRRRAMIAAGGTAFAATAAAAVAVSFDGLPAAGLVAVVTAAVWIVMSALVRLVMATIGHRSVPVRPRPPHQAYPEGRSTGRLLLDRIMQ